MRCHIILYYRDCHYSNIPYGRAIFYLYGCNKRRSPRYWWLAPLAVNSILLSVHCYNSLRTVHILSAFTYMGLSHASAICSGVAAITAFVEGTLVGRNPDHWIMSMFALFLIVLGILGIGFNETFTSSILKLCRSDAETVEMMPPAQNDDDASLATPAMVFRLSPNEHRIQRFLESQPLYEHTTSAHQQSGYNDYINNDDDLMEVERDTNVYKLRGIGFLFSVLSGICFGSQPFPEEFTAENTTEIHFLPSFGVGVMLMIIINCAILAVMNKNEQGWYFKECFVPGVVSGMFWSVAFLAILYATEMIDYSIALSIKQNSICIKVFIGIYWFKEITDKRAIIFTLISLFVVLIGDFLLTIGVDE